jgi:peptidoglycan/xylan/chitin deacetylase (PgdA/CDA1 family)
MAVNGLSVPLPAGSVVILNVHGIGPATRPFEPGEDRVWVTVDQFEQVLDAVAGRDDVRFTFDDGNASDVEIALPRLVEAKVKAEFFVCAGLLGEPGRVDADGVRELVKAGMRVGSHGWLHRDWRRVNESEAREEFVEAQRVIGDLIGSPVTTAAIPFGSYDRHVLRRLRPARLRRVYTSDGGPARPDSWLQPRTSLHTDLDAAWIAWVLNDATPVARRAYRTAARAVKRWRG